MTIHDLSIAFSVQMPLDSEPSAHLMGFEWPASQLDSSHMRALRAISKDVRIPITILLKDAVEVWLTLVPKMVAQQVAEQSDSLSPQDHGKD